MQFADRQELRKRLSEAGLKATHQRIVVYEALMALHGQHPVAEEVYRHLQPANPSISLGTVYKTLDTFVETGFIRRVLSEEGGKRYDVNTIAHNHIYCSNTKEILDFEDDELSQLLTDFFRRRHLENFDIQTITVHLTGKKKAPGQQIRITQVSK
ncbi:Fur family transcriptional regulator [Botryobacter ruber]|uniref:Fur family transcriptional regulator n=1 Tax=Botryobacter ruber TaxID=2171629 RepID=UPI000E0ADF05|nr:Fur family transcriptional regulator [Botryobacter ruber]